MDDLVTATLRHGFTCSARRSTPPERKDPVADWMVQGWGYPLALDNPHLYRVMFGD